MSRVFAFCTTVFVLLVVIGLFGQGVDATGGQISSTLRVYSLIPWAVLIGTVAQGLIRFLSWFRRWLIEFWRRNVPSFRENPDLVSKKAVRWAVFAFVLYLGGYFVAWYIATTRPPFINRIAESSGVEFLVTGVVLVLPVPLSTSQVATIQLPNLGSAFNIAVLTAVVFVPSLALVVSMANAMKIVEDWHIRFYRMMWHLTMVDEDQLPTLVIENQFLRSVIVGLNLGSTIAVLYTMWLII